MKVIMKLTQWVNIQKWRTRKDSMFVFRKFDGSKYHVCFLFLLDGELENELDLSSYSLSSKTSRYTHFGRNRITGYGHSEFRLMLPLQPQFWISEHSDCRFVTSGFPLMLSSLLPNNRISVCQDPDFRFQFGYILPNIRTSVCQNPDCRLLQ